MKEIIVVIFIFIASIHCSAIKSEQSHHEHGTKGKDGNHHMGFVGSRGKRSINTQDPSMMMEAEPENADFNEDEWPLLTQTLYDIQRNIRAPKGFFGMRGKKDFTNAEKRALMGIQQNLNGLRGRTRFIEASPNGEENMVEPEQFVGNRISDQSYYDVRGGKYNGDYAKTGSSLGEKRAPKGFLGMRGKKRDGEVNDDDFEYNFYEKRIPNGFTGVRGKKDSSMLQ